MEQLLEKVKVQVDRSSVNLPEDRKTLQEFGKIWKVVYEKLKRSPDQVQKYRDLVKRVANSATTGMIDKLAGQYSFMGKLFNVEVDKNKWSEYSPTPWRIAFAGNIPGETQTIPLAIFSFMQIPGKEMVAVRLVLFSILISIIAMIAAELLNKKMKARINK